MYAPPPPCSRYDIATLHEIEPEAQVGSPAPDFSLPQRFQLRRFSELRGTPVILVFSPTAWDPSAAEQLSFLKKLLAECAPACVNLRELSYGNENYFLKFDSPQSSTMISVLHDFDPSGGIAHSFGVHGDRAVVVVDAEGLLRERYVIPAGTMPRADRLKEAFGMLHSNDGSAAPNKAGQMMSVNRRQFVASAIAASLALWAWPAAALADTSSVNPQSKSDAVFAPTSRSVTLQVNGDLHTLDLDTRVTLLDALRENLGLSGTKKGCDQGTCGACTVIVDGRRIKSCMTLAAMEEGKQIATIEGLAQGDRLSPMQQAFIDADALQCGYCTPGQIMSAVALVQEGHAGSEGEIREWMSGNICRCGAYAGIVAAISNIAKGAKA
jgi:xanthine dehydrogenase YagT iron-sulfur-binding subunit